MIKIVFSDVDGTLLDGIRGFPRVSKKNLYAISALKEKGILFIVASGRSKFIINEEIEEAHPDGFILCNGANVICDSKVLLNDVLDAGLIDNTVEIIKKIGGTCLYENSFGLYSLKEDGWNLNDFVRKWNIPLLKVTYVDSINFPVNKIIPVFKSDSDCKKFDMIVNHKLLEVKKQKGMNAFDVNPKGINKGNGVREILKYYGISKDDACAFGDNINDMEMLENVGESVAMGNASSILKEKAKYTCEDALDDGFYRWLLKNRIIDEE